MYDDIKSRLWTLTCMYDVKYILCTYDIKSRLLISEILILLILTYYLYYYY